MTYQIIKSPEIETRNQFAELCTLRDSRIAIEIGTDQGVFASEFMKRFTGHELICVDDYKSYEWFSGDRLPDMMMAVHALMNWHGRTRLIVDQSERFAKTLPKYILERLDFVYIDADHSYEGAKKDIDTWWPLLTDRGILAGHDFERESHPGVVQAVEEFAQAQDLTVYLTDTENPSPSSWYVYRNHP